MLKLQTAANRDVEMYITVHVETQSRFTLGKMVLHEWHSYALLLPYIKSPSFVCLEMYTLIKISDCKYDLCESLEKQTFSWKGLST